MSEGSDRAFFGVGGKEAVSQAPRHEKRKSVRTLLAVP